MLNIYSNKETEATKTLQLPKHLKDLEVFLKELLFENIPENKDLCGITAISKYVYKSPEMVLIHLFKHRRHDGKQGYSLESNCFMIQGKDYAYREEILEKLEKFYEEKDYEMIRLYEI